MSRVLPSATGKAYLTRSVLNFLRLPVAKPFHGERRLLLLGLALARFVLVMARQVHRVLAGAAKVDVDPPAGVVHVGHGGRAGQVVAGGAAAEGDRAVVLETVLDQVEVVGGVQDGPQGQLLAAPRLHQNPCRQRSACPRARRGRGFRRPPCVPCPRSGRACPRPCCSA